jgi:hypothetical protein
MLIAPHELPEQPQFLQKKEKPPLLQGLSLGV